MPAVNQSFDSLSFLSDSLRDMLRRRLREIAGVTLVLAAILLGAALGSWSVQDPSLSHATVNPVRNLLGLPGAITADLMMQLLGLGALALVLPIAVWGWRLASHRALRREWLRIAVWVIGVLLASTFASCVPASHAWPLPAGLGGVIGDGLLRGALLAAHGQPPGWDRILIASLAGGGAFLALALACGIGWHERADEAEDEDEEPVAAKERAEPRASVSLGFIVHGLLSLKWRLTRWLVRRRSGVVPVKRAARTRTEPRLDEHSRATLAPEIEDEEIEEAEEEEED
jgi:S-DNA-T family DNA segregation ATPase FtsK/SpoIIIE